MDARERRKTPAAAGKGPTPQDTVLLQLQFSQMVLRKNVGDVTHEESLRAFAPGTSCLNWILAHVVATRCRTLQALGGEPIWTDAACRRYDRHAPPLTDASEARPLAQLWSDLDREQERLVAAIRRLTPEDLSRPAPPDSEGDPVRAHGELLAVFGFHDAYHAGQTGLVRRFLGRPPADL
jgi:uncharacterized damage-inducible protein DinB